MKIHLSQFILWGFVAANFFSTSTVFGKEAIFQAEIDQNGEQVIDITGENYSFNPDRIVVKANVPVVLRVKKEKGFIPHDFTLKNAAAGIEIKESLDEKPKIIRFTPTQAGTMTFYCGEKFLFFKSHRDKGMQGTLEVVE
ncbi:MAG: cupredoxin domain-containing protein [Gammaproteobacteria bacterium]